MLTRPFNSGQRYRDRADQRREASGAQAARAAARRRESDVEGLRRAGLDNKLWGRFGDRETAERVAARLRQLGLAAKVDGADECET